MVSRCTQEDQPSTTPQTAHSTASQTRVTADEPNEPQPQKILRVK